MAKILLVEDNEMNRDMLSRRLERKGYEVAIAVDGQQGVAMAQREAPDLILMDMSLPVLDGWEATRQLKADAGDQRDPDHRPHRPRHVGRPREGAGGRLRRLRHQADRAAAAARQDRGALLGRLERDHPPKRSPSCGTSCARRSITSSATAKCCSRTPPRGAGQRDRRCERDPRRRPGGARADQCALCRRPVVTSARRTSRARNRVARAQDGSLAGDRRAPARADSARSAGRARRPTDPGCRRAAHGRAPRGGAIPSPSPSSSRRTRRRRRPRPGRSRAHDAGGGRRGGEPRVLERRLGAPGPRRGGASGGRTGPRACSASGAFDLVLLDVLMPDLDGFAVLERIKAEPATPRHPRDHDLGAGRHGQRGPLHRARGGGLPPQAV